MVDTRRHHAFLPQCCKDKPSKKGLVSVLFRCCEIFLFPACGFKFHDLAAGELFSEGFPVCAGIHLPLLQNSLDLCLPGFHGVPVITVLLKRLPCTSQILHRFDHLSKGMQILVRIVLNNQLITAPGREIFIPHEAVIRQVSGSPVPQIHDCGLLRLEQTVGVDPCFQIVRLAGAVPKTDFPLRSVRKQFKETVVRVVDNQRRSPGKVAVGPGVRQYMHRDPHSLRTASLRQLYRAFDEVSVWTADQAKFVPVQSGTFFPLRI